MMGTNTSPLYGQVRNYHISDGGFLVICGKLQTLDIKFCFFSNLLVIFMGNKVSSLRVEDI